MGLHSYTLPAFLLSYITDDADASSREGVGKLRDAIHTLLLTFLTHHVNFSSLINFKSHIMLIFVF